MLKSPQISETVTAEPVSAEPTVVQDDKVMEQEVEVVGVVKQVREKVCQYLSGFGSGGLKSSGLRANLQTLEQALSSSSESLNLPTSAPPPTDFTSILLSFLDVLSCLFEESAEKDRVIGELRERVVGMEESLARMKE